MTGRPRTATSFTMRSAVWIVLGKSYLMQEQSLSEVEVAGKIETIYAEFNRIIHRDLFKITRSNGRYHLVRENDDLEPIGNGGFANVYRQKSIGFVVKKLKDDYLTDTGIRSRFKREYNITKSLQDIFSPEVSKEPDKVTYLYDTEPTLSMVAEEPVHYGMKKDN